MNRSLIGLIVASLSTACGVAVHESDDPSAGTVVGLTKTVLIYKDFEEGTPGIGNEDPDFSVGQDDNCTLAAFAPAPIHYLAGVTYGSQTDITRVAAWINGSGGLAGWDDSVIYTIRSQYTRSSVNHAMWSVALAGCSTDMVNEMYRFGVDVGAPATWQLSGYGGGLDCVGTTDTGVTAAPDTIYNTDMEVKIVAGEVFLRAKVWPNSISEPSSYQVSCSQKDGLQRTDGDVGFKLTRAGGGTGVNANNFEFARVE